MDILKDFYPTPRKTIAKMLEGISKDTFRGSILDMGAGKGDISDYIKEQAEAYDSYYSRRGADIDVIEINEELQHILKGKEYRLIHDDIRTFNTHRCYDLIVANFPFSIGDECLQRALYLVENNGGQLRCLVNAETIRNPYTPLRKELVKKLTDLNAELEYLVDHFTDAERSTEVEAVLIKVLVKKESSSVILDSLQKSEVVEDADFAGDSLVSNNYLEQVIEHYNYECRVGKSLINEYYSVMPHIMSAIKREGKEDYSKPLITLKVGERSSGEAGITNAYLEGVREKYWAILIRDSSFTSSFTSNIVEDLERKLKELRQYDFSLFNIRELEKELKSKITQGINDSILKMFEEFSCKYSWYKDSDNLHYYNGWASNKAHKINSKIILPINGTEATYSKEQRWNYYIRKRLHDMVKVFDFLARDRDTDTLQLVGNAMHFAEQRQDFTLDLRYFTIKFYKKGTCHIKFMDMELLEKFNIYGSQRKGWLPPSYGKANYEDMSVEEQTVIDEFQGREAYEAVMKDAGYYLAPPETLLLGA